jgi:hypothetical protein
MTSLRDLRRNLKFGAGYAARLLEEAEQQERLADKIIKLD